MSDVTLDSGGVEVVSAYGSPAGTTVLSGAIQDVPRGTVSNTTISSGGVESVGINGATFDTVVSGGAVEILSGYSYAIGTTMLIGGELILGSGAMVSGAVGSGTEILQRNAQEGGDTVASGGLDVVQGWASGAVLAGGSGEVVSSAAGASIYGILDGGAIHVVSSDGAAGR